MRSFVSSGEAALSEGGRGGDLPIKDKKGKLRRNKQILKPPQLPSSDAHTGDGIIISLSNIWLSQ